MRNFTFLDKKQIFGDGKLEILKKYGIKCSLTDFAILLGGFVASDYYTSEGELRKNRAGWWWTKTSENGYVYVTSEYGDNSLFDVFSRNVGARPAIQYSSIQLEVLSRNVLENGIVEVEYGEYPQTVASTYLNIKLEEAYKFGTIKKTGKSYTTDSVFFRLKDTCFQSKTHTEYEYLGKKYIRFVGDENSRFSMLSNGHEVDLRKVYWIRVEPIKWLVDEESDIALSKQILFSGVQYNRKTIQNETFDETYIKIFMDKYFSKEIISNSLENVERKSVVKKEENFTQMYVTLETLLSDKKKLEKQMEIIKQKIKVLDMQIEKFNQK